MSCHLRHTTWPDGPGHPQDRTSPRLSGSCSWWGDPGSPPPHPRLPFPAAFRGIPHAPAPAGFSPPAPGPCREAPGPSRLPQLSQGLRGVLPGSPVPRLAAGRPSAPHLIQPPPPLVPGTSHLLSLTCVPSACSQSPSGCSRARSNPVSQDTAGLPGPATFSQPGPRTMTPPRGLESLLHPHLHRGALGDWPLLSAPCVLIPRWQCLSHVLGDCCRAVPPAPCPDPTRTPRRPGLVPFITATRPAPAQGARVSVLCPVPGSGWGLGPPWGWTSRERPGVPLPGTPRDQPGDMCGRTCGGPLGRARVLGGCPRRGRWGAVRWGWPRTYAHGICSVPEYGLL